MAITARIGIAYASSPPLPLLGRPARTAMIRGVRRGRRRDPRPQQQPAPPPRTWQQGRNQRTPLVSRNTRSAVLAIYHPIPTRRRSEGRRGRRLCDGTVVFAAGTTELLIREQVLSSRPSPPPPPAVMMGGAPALWSLPDADLLSPPSSPQSPVWEEVISCGRRCPYAYDGECDDGGSVCPATPSPYPPPAR